MISETEAEEDGVFPEIVPPAQLQVLIKQSGLPESKSIILAERFSDLFKLASEWAKKAKDIIVTSGDQIVTIKHARAGRLLLREKRLEIENIRKILKADALKEGQAIDRIANFLKDLIIPTEEHLDRQENFVKYQKEAEEQVRRIELEKRMEEDRIRKEKYDELECEKLRAENERLKAEQIKRDKEASDKLASERNRARALEDELAKKKQMEMKSEADRIRAEENLLKGGDTAKMIAFKISVQSIVIPEVKSSENKRIIEDAKSHLFLAVSKIKMEEEE